MNKKPMVSIIIPVYNGSNYVKNAIDSALSQDYKNFEIIVINDGSNDKNKTRNICLSYGKQIRYYEKENGGVSSALNFGISKMKGEYFSWLSHDDLYKENKLSSQIEEIKKHDINTILYSNYSIVDENNNFIKNIYLDTKKYDNKPLYLIFDMLINGITLLIPKKAFEDCGLFDESLRCIQDYELWYKMMGKYKFHHMKEVLGSTRVHSKQVSNVSTKVISEGNWFYKKITDELNNNLKIEYEGSEYMFLDTVEKKLRYNSKYIEAADYILEQKKNILNKYQVDFEKKSVCYIINDLSYDKDYIKEIINIKYPNIDFKLISENSKIDVSTYDYIFIGNKIIDLCNFIKLIEVTNLNIICDYTLENKYFLNLNKFSKFLHLDLNNVFIRNENYKIIDVNDLFDIAFQCIMDEKILFNELIISDYSMSFSNIRKILSNKYISKLNDEEYANLCYQVAVLYNKNTNKTLLPSIKFYEECEKYKALSYSRAWKLYQKIIEILKRNK